MPKKKKPDDGIRKTDIVFPKREATIRDVARFAHWAGIEVHFNLTPITPPKEPEKNG